MIPEQIEKIKDFLPCSPLLELNDPWLKPFNISVSIKRDDLIDSRISGNKFRKLKHALIRFHDNEFEGIVSFGGPWSNHLHALSAVAEKYKIPFVAIVRGEKPAIPSHTLNDILKSGTRVVYVTREQYRQFRTLAEEGRLHKHEFFQRWSDYMLIPEGGCSVDSLLGVAEIITEITDEIAVKQLPSFDAIYSACGTAATLAGLSLGLSNSPTTQLIGIAALRAGKSLQQNVRRLLSDYGQPASDNWLINDDYHFGGFAKINIELTDFMKQIFERTGLITEPVYTAKTLFAVYQHIAQGKFPSGSRIMMLHTGGLQGLRGFHGKGIDNLISTAGYA
ncbi:MAG: pyridoxal-phosphate dependent enzyme [Gammaproteobacteria bacterium]|nr:pyridoxal-phosphate dependent enzyme [Gammaproteobacteria bacterium]